LLNRQTTWVLRSIGKSPVNSNSCAIIAPSNGISGLKLAETSYWAAPQTQLVKSVKRTIFAGILYFAMVMSAGFVLGVLRVPFLVPRIGERWAELAEMPIMAAVIFLAAGYVLRRFPELVLPHRALAAGFLALTLSVCAELGLALMLQNRTLTEFLSSRDKVSGCVYLALLLVFAVMPRLRLASIYQVTSGR
jgi:hypothetical protein